MIEHGTSRQSVLERRTAQSLVGPKTDSLKFMPYPGFEPGTFGATADSPSHSTAWSELSFEHVKNLEEQISF